MSREDSLNEWWETAGEFSFSREGLSPNLDEQQGRGSSPVGDNRSQLVSGGALDNDLLIVKERESSVGTELFDSTSASVIGTFKGEVSQGASQEASQEASQIASQASVLEEIQYESKWGR